jgi:hypothetical protein
MSKKIFIFVFSLLELLSFVSITAQTNPTFQRMLQNGWEPPFANGFRRLTPAEVDSSFLKSMGYNDSTVANCRKNGIDLVGRWKKSVVWDEKTSAAMSDCIVIGKVSRIEHPFGAKSWFQTVAYVQVEEFLRNDYQLPKGLIQIMIVSGPTKTLLGEDTLSIGEHVLLFLSASSLITFAANNNITDLYNQLINDSAVKFEILAKYDIRAGKMFSQTRERDSTTVRSEITSVLNLVHRAKPTNK